MMKCKINLGYHIAREGWKYINSSIHLSEKMKVDVHVIPRSRETKIVGYDVWKRALVVKVRAPPEEGKANFEVEKLLSEFFGTRVFIVSGHRSRKKVVEIEDLDRSEIYDRLKRI